MNEPDNSSQTEAKTIENACADDRTMDTLTPNSLRLIVIAIRRALVGAVKLCDQLVDQLKTK